jgi:hypothetical protein
MRHLRRFGIFRKSVCTFSVRICGISEGSAYSEKVFALFRCAYAASRKVRHIQKKCLHFFGAHMRHLKRLGIFRKSVCTFSVRTGAIRTMQKPPQYLRWLFLISVSTIKYKPDGCCLCALKAEKLNFSSYRILPIRKWLGLLC